jgi:hypothetical protein
MALAPEAPEARNDDDDYLEPRPRIPTKVWKSGKVME